MDNNLIKIIRKSKKINLSELSKRTGISRQKISRIEKNEGNYSFESFKTICDYLDIKIILTI